MSRVARQSLSVSAADDSVNGNFHFVGAMHISLPDVLIHREYWQNEFRG